MLRDALFALIVVPTTLVSNTSYQLYWTGMRISLTLSLALFLRRPLPQILVFTRSLPRQISAQIVLPEVDIDMSGWPDWRPGVFVAGKYQMQGVIP